MMQQLDLFHWADARPTAEVIEWIPHLARKLWLDRRSEPIQHEARILPLFDHAREKKVS